MNDTYYVPSNRLPAGAVVLATAFALAAIVPAWLYAWLTLHSPLLLLDWFALLVFALGMGLAAQLAARLGKARNPLWMGRLGLLIGVSGWYAQWAAWLAVAEADSFVSLFGDPHGMWRFASFVVDSEVRTIAGMRIEGSVLVASWLIELILLISLPRSMARAAAETPFCEATNDWMTSFELPRRFAWIEHPEVLVHRLETAPGQLLSILEPCNEEQPDRYSTVTLHCGGTDPFLSIENVRVSRRANKEKRRIQPVIAYLRLPGMDIGQLLGAGTGLVSTTSTMPVSA